MSFLVDAACTGEFDSPPRRDGNNPAPRSSQNKAQLLEATMRNVPKLKELNYTQWKNVITNSIKKAKLWGYVDGSIEEPSEHDASSLTTYFDEAAAVRNAILGSLEPTAQKYIEEALDPKDAWLALGKKYLTAEAETDRELVSIEQRLADLRLEEGGDMIEHIAEFCRMRSHVSGTRFDLDDQASISMLYRSLPSSYRQLALTPNGAEMKDFNALCARLSYLSQNPEPQASAPTAPVENYTNWGVPEDIKVFGLTGDKNPLLEERAAATCRDCLLKDHEAGTPECPQYEWRRELWGDSHGDARRATNASEGTDTRIPSSNKKCIYEFSEPIKAALSFEEMKLKEQLVQALNRSNVRIPYGIQQCAILPTISGRNVIAQAPPETGKTAAILLSVIQLMDASKRGIQALVLSPTEQKAIEIQSMINTLGYQCHRSTSNQHIRDDLAQLAQGHNFPILVGTPDRVQLLFRQGILRTSEVRILALDDLDILVDDGLNPQVLDIYRHLPRSVQTLSIGSDSPTAISREALGYINNPIYITISRHDRALGGVTHAFIVIPDDRASNRKPAILRQLITSGTIQVRAGVLCDTFDEVDAVRSQLSNYTSGCYHTHSDMSSEEHHQIVRNFRTSTSYHLITTCSVPLKRVLGAWSGDHFWMVNYHIPSSPQNYLERVNYLGFCSGKNMAITLVNDGTDEINMIQEIERHFDIQMVELRWNGSSLS